MFPAFAANPESLILYFHQWIDLQRYENLPSSVVNFSEEVSIIILGGISVLSQPQGKDEEMSGEKGGKNTQVINSEPFVGTFGGKGGGGGEDDGEESSGNGGDSLHDLGLGRGGESSLHNIGC